MEQHRQDTVDYSPSWLSPERNVILGQKLNSLCLRRAPPRRRPTFFSRSILLEHTEITWVCNLIFLEQKVPTRAWLARSLEQQKQYRERHYFETHLG